MDRQVFQANGLVGRVFVRVALLAALLLTGAQAQMEYSEAPQLAARVAAGQLPPVSERLPQNPLVVEPHERIGDYGGVWRMGLRGGQDGALFIRTLYDHLVRWNIDWTEVIPNVAESFEVNEAATEFTFRLREGMKWSDGQPFTADDIVFWYEDVLTNEAYRAVNPIPSWLQAGDEPVVVEKLDDTTVVFRFAAPNGLFIQRLATPDGNLPTRFPRHYLEQFHPKYNPEGIDAQIREAGASDWVNLMGLKAGGVPGTPYDARWANPDLPTLYAWTITTGYGEGARVTAERNPYYFKVDPEGNQLPYIDRLVYEQFEDVEVLVLRALAGDIDMQDRHIGTLGNRAVFTDNMERGNYHFFSKVPAFMNAAVIALNLTHKDPVKREIFNNKDFRIGLSYAINRDEINDLVFVGQTEPFQAAPRPESPFYNERMAKQYTEFDLALANEHLDRAGYSQRDAQGYRLGPDGNRISFVVEITAAVNPFWLDIMELVQGYWQEVGIDAQVRNIDRALLYTRKDANEHDAMVWQGDGGLDVVLEPRWYFPFSAESVYAQAWQTWYNNPSGVGSLTDPEEPPAITRRQMELYDQLKATGDPEQQTALMNEILEIAADEFYAIGTVLMPPGYGIVKNNFHNVPESMIDAYLYPHPGPTNPEQYFVESGSQ